MSIDLFKCLYEHTTVRMPQTDMDSDKITFNTWVTQDSVPSPLLFPHFIIVLSQYLTDIESKKKVSHGIPDISPFNHILFTNDMTLIPQNSEDEIVLFYPLLHTPRTTHDVYLHCIIFSVLWNRSKPPVDIPR